MADLGGPQAVDEALATVREGLELDGHELDVAFVGGIVAMTIRSGAAACADCLLPDDVLEGIARGALARRGLDHPVRIVHDPPGGRLP